MINKLKKLCSLLAFGTIGGLLGALGGTDGVSKGVRRYGIPLLITLSALCIIQNWWVLTIMSMVGALSMGYGMPCFIKGWEDEGSSLGKFWYYLVLKRGYKATKAYLLASICTRVTIGLLICLSLISIPILKGNWLIYSLCSLGITIVWGALSWRDLGIFKFFKKNLTWSEFITYSIMSLLVWRMII